MVTSAEQASRIQKAYVARGKFRLAPAVCRFIKRNGCETAEDARITLFADNALPMVNRPQ